MEFLRAETIDDVLDVLAARRHRAELLAGGTHVMRRLAQGVSNPDTLVQLDGLRSELAGVSRDGDRVVIGALTTLRDVAEHPLLCDRYRAVCQAAGCVGGWQTQSVATLGGNVCDASPSADLLPPLLVHDALVTLRSAARGEHSVELGRFLTGSGETRRQADELVTAFSLDPPPETSADVYLKVGRRGAMEVAIAGLAARLDFETSGREVAAARLATCSVGPVPTRAVEAERLLVGPLDPDRIARAGERLAAESSPVDDERASASYRRAVLPRLLIRAVRECRAAVAAT